VPGTQQQGQPDGENCGGLSGKFIGAAGYHGQDKKLGDGMMAPERYSIIWQECGANSRTAQRFFVPGYEGYLPFFLWGAELEAIEKKEKVELREEHLLKGILYGLYEFDHSPKPWHRKKDRETLLYLLDVLGNGFKSESPEKMILDVAYSLREKNGHGASRIVLKVGNDLIPQSSKIKSDLICDLWAVVAERGEESNDIFEEIISLVPQIDFDQIHSDAKEIVCYYGLCAMVFLESEDGITSYLSKYVYPNVSMSKLKHKIKAFLENPNDFSPADLKVVQQSDQL
jgi:hypothetical protein